MSDQIRSGLNYAGQSHIQLVFTSIYSQIMGTVYAGDDTCNRVVASL